MVPVWTRSGIFLYLATLRGGLPLGTLSECAVVLVACVYHWSSYPSLVALNNSVNALRWSISLLTSGGVILPRSALVRICDHGEGVPLGHALLAVQEVA